MKYVSTRGEAPVLGFSDVLMAGLAADGGLYVPEQWPTLSEAEIASFAYRPYAEIAGRVIAPFVGDDIDGDQLNEMIAAAAATFRHPATTPVTQIAPNHFLLELFHGPTLAFKDVAMQLLARLVDRKLAETGERATIVGATSGDTGAAAVEAFRGRPNADVVILFPEGRVSPVQRRQMTTVADENVHVLAVEGTFDDCQAIVKDMFAHEAFRRSVGLTGVNSINWARIVAQVGYYFAAATALGAPHREVSFTVPTGNFGDIFAGYVAKRMGLPIRRLVIATNVNDILVRALTGGDYRTGAVTPTSSPSMDIQVSSNFERLLFEAYGRDGAAVSGLMARLKQGGGFEIGDGPLERIRAEFSAASSDEAATRETIARIHRATDLVIDPHTAVGVGAAEAHLDDGVPMVTLSTAHPAKFPDAVEAAIGRAPLLPEALSDLGDRTERMTRIAADTAAVEAFVLDRSRAASSEAAR
ncbi:threonine synthase [Amorphus orientalis]|uniref:Threonine synthase n=1 Tax=Amorphus orientalis TaxID=649198 RepID=A0AAE3VR13_9HYPH|nr:threonine synthase [Amorphus orientalis]MDQ0316161.1 threonine synthase [Amorphus orientalis]